MERLVRLCAATAGTSFRNRDGVYRNKGMAISGKLALCSMARSINNGTGGGEIQIRTRERVFTPQLFYRRVYVLSRRCSFHARQSRDYARTSAYVRTVSTPSPRQNPFFHGWNMWEGGGPTASRDNSELCLSSSGYWPLFPTESRAFSPLFSFVNLRGVPRFGGHPFFLQPVHTETILRFETLVASKNAPRRSSIHLLLFHPCPSFDLTAEIFLEIREGGVFRSRITPRRYFGR